MAILWQSSLVPFFDPNGAPYSGAQVYFFNAGTTTPRTVYADAGLGIAHDHPVVANSAGMFPAVFLPPGDYRQRIETATGVTLNDTDGISTPTTGDSGGGGGGDTPVELLPRTGDYKFRHDIGSHSGWVRAAGRTIGAAASGATERANADCEALFLRLWGVDATLAVSGGRGANAASDWAGGKTIALPDLRLRGLIGMGSMGNSLSTLIAAAAFDSGENGDTVGATVGAGTVTLIASQMPTHAHDAETTTDGAHSHQYTAPAIGNDFFGSNFSSTIQTTAVDSTTTSGAHSHDVVVQNAGGGAAHPNVQPSAVATCYLKL